MEHLTLLSYCLPAMETKLVKELALLTNPCKFFFEVSHVLAVCYFEVVVWKGALLHHMRWIGSADPQHRCPSYRSFEGGVHVPAQSTHGFFAWILVDWVVPYDLAVTPNWLGGLIPLL